jgi:hypothetical protein
MPRKPHFGKLRPRYRFALNPYPEVRWSSCPRCRKLTHMRKFPLLILVEDAGLVALGYTGRYCTPCEFIIAHQEELETELAILFEKKLPEAVGNEYFVIGTIEMPAWRKSLTDPMKPDEMREHTADFKQVLQLNDPRPRWIIGPGKSG